MSKVSVYLGDDLSKYHFGESHPFGPLRLNAFSNEFYRRKLDKQVDIIEPHNATQKDLEAFHTSKYVKFVKQQSESGTGFLDKGDTPAVTGIYDAACTVVGTVLNAVDDVMDKNHCRAFIPIAGLHHARRNTASGFCVFNDCGIAIEVLREKHNIKRVAYVDIDAHHGDGVFYEFEDDPELIFADIHEDGHFLYPGTGHAHETGTGDARETKLNIPLPPEADDRQFDLAWEKVLNHLAEFKPEFILLQCGADSIKNDPITHLQFTHDAHHRAARDLSRLADKYSQGRLIAMGGGGYNLENIASGWNAVVEGLLEDH